MNRLPSAAHRWLTAICLGWLWVSATALADPDLDPPGRVVRINLAEGRVAMQPGGTTTWTDDVANRPLTTGDRIWADPNARAELHIGSTAVRLGAETGITLGTIDDHAAHLQLSAGALQVRVRALGPDDTFEIATPFATVAILTPGSFRVDVTPRGDELRVAVSEGQVAVTDGSGATTVSGGRESLFHGAVAAAESNRLARGDALDQWASERDRREDRSVSTRYVSREVIGYEDLDDYGTWQVVDEYGPVWRPNVAYGWSPYRQGHWIWVSPWGWTWVDDAPWGFAPFHYGRWVNWRGSWCWTPGPRHQSPYYAPALVGWVGGFSVGVTVGGPPVAWFPLGWNEVYVPSYRTSRQYVQNVNVTNIHVTNVTVNEYYDRARGDRDDRRRGAPPDYRNFGISGAVVSTTRSAFASGQPVNAHPADLPRVNRPRVDHVAPDVAPTPQSYGRPAGIAPRQDIFSRPVMGPAMPSENPRPEDRRVPPRAPDYRPPAQAVPSAPPENRSFPIRPEGRDNVVPAPTNRMPSGAAVPDYRPPAPPRTPSPVSPEPSPENRTTAPRPDWRPGAVPDNRPEPTPTIPDYRPPTAPRNSPPPVPENRYTPPRPDWRPSAPENRPDPTPIPDYRPAPVTAPSNGRAEPPPSENRYSPPARNEWRPEPTQPVERPYEAPRAPEYRPAPPPPAAPAPVMRDYRPPAPPPAAAPPAQRPSSAPPPKDDRRDRPH